MSPILLAGMKDLKYSVAESGDVVVICTSQSQATWISNPHILSKLYPLLRKLEPAIRNIHVIHSAAVYNLADFDAELIAIKKVKVT